MRRNLTIGIALLLSTWIGSGHAFPADYFTELEIDEIREAQQIDRRVNILLKIGRVRLASLGLAEVEEELKQTQGQNNALTRAIVRVLAPGAAGEMEKARAEADRVPLENDLSHFTRADLLLGYYQALEETMDNLDDAYERKREIRKPLESLRQFTMDSIPLLEQFEPENESEEIALEDATRQARLAMEGAEAALGTLPKTQEDK